MNNSILESIELLIKIKSIYTNKNSNIQIYVNFIMQASTWIVNINCIQMSGF